MTKQSIDPLAPRRGRRAAAPAAWLRRVDAVDRRLFDRAAHRRSATLDLLLPHLTRSADHGVLWLGIAAGLGLSGGRRRRAAVRGLAALGLASATVNTVAKFAAQRPRPDRAAVPVVRLLRRQPETTSFPSGHSASAAAFASGVLLEQPAIGVPVAVIAAGVAYGRVHTGVHYPGDVLAGVAVGLAATAVVARAWPVRPDRPAVNRVSAEAPALPDGDGLVLVVNANAGSADALGSVEHCLREQLPRAQIIRSEQVERDLRAAADTARVLGVMGGDGTVNCAAGIAWERRLPLAVVPGGTLNHFAGEVGIAGVEDMARAVAAGSAVRISLGSSSSVGDGGWFLNTFALGVYPDLVRERERHEERIGKWPAMALALARVLHGAQPVAVDVDGTPRLLWTLFAGNGRYHPAGFAPTWRERMDDGLIDLRLVDADRPLARLRLVAAVLTGTLGRSHVYEEQVVREVAVRARSGAFPVARDGEVDEGVEELRLRAASRPLTVYRPLDP